MSVPRVRLRMLFKSDGPAGASLQVESVTGTESISGLFQFNLTLHSSNRDVDFDAVLKNGAHLTIRQRAAHHPKRNVNLPVHGILSSFEQLGEKHDQAIYRAILVPRLWRLSLNQDSRIFMNESVPEIVRQVLTNRGFVEGEDFDLGKISAGRYPKREYVVQYQESDLNFLMRLCEDQGISFYFHHLEDRECVVFGDNNFAFLPHSPARGTDEVHYRPWIEPVPPAWGDIPSEKITTLMWPESIHHLVFRQRPAAAKVQVSDYNYRHPSDSISEEKEVDKEGTGTRRAWGDHVKTGKEAKALAQVRKEEIECRKLESVGKGNVRSFRAGLFFTLAGFPRKDANQTYLLSEVWHRATQMVLHNKVSSTYENEFVAVPYGKEFRPLRVTPKPKVTGTITAVVDGSGEGTYAKIDEQGRYKVRFPWDRAGRDAEKASRFLRMMQPYSGNEYGTHFPLHRGVEVRIEHTDGDPDRPYIAGTLPNPQTLSPVTSKNSSQSVIETAGGNTIVMEDLEDAQYVWASTPQFDTYLNLGKGEDDPEGRPVPNGATLATQKEVSINAGECVSIAAGSPEHGKGILSAGTLLKGVATAAAAGLPILSMVGGLGKVGVVATVTALLGLTDEVVSAAAGSFASSAYITAPGRAATIGGTDALMAGGGAANVIGGLSANLMSPCTVLVSGLLGTSIASARNVEISSHYTDVTIKAKKEIDLLSRTKNISLRTEKEDIRILANRNFSLHASEGEGTIYTKKGMAISDLNENDPFVVLKAGESAILLEKEKITIESPWICLRSKDGETMLNLVNKDKPQAEFAPSSFFACTKGTMQLLAGEKLAMTARDQLGLAGDKRIWFSTDLIDQENCKKRLGPASIEESQGGGGSYGEFQAKPPRPSEEKVIEQRLEVLRRNFERSQPPPPPAPDRSAGQRGSTPNQRPPRNGPPPPPPGSNPGSGWQGANSRAGDGLAGELDRLIKPNGSSNGHS